MASIFYSPFEIWVEIHNRYSNGQKLFSCQMVQFSNEIWILINFVQYSDDSSVQNPISVESGFWVFGIQIFTVPVPTPSNKFKANDASSLLPSWFFALTSRSPHLRSSDTTGRLPPALARCRRFSTPWSFTAAGHSVPGTKWVRECCSLYWKHFKQPTSFDN